MTDSVSHSMFIITHAARQRVTDRTRPHLELLDVVGRDVQADAYGDEEEADDEEGGQHGAGREDGLPGGQPLLLEGRVVRLLALQRPGAGHGDVPVLLLGVVAGRHHGAVGSLVRCRPGRGSAVLRGRRACVVWVGVIGRC